jgi:hypothetical protein
MSNKYDPPDMHLPFPVKNEEYIGKHHRMAMGQEHDQKVEKSELEADRSAKGKGTLHLSAKGRGKASDSAPEGLAKGPPKC